MGKTERKWNKAFRRMNREAAQKVAEHEKRWDRKIQQLCDEWNETAEQLKKRG